MPCLSRAARRLAGGKPEIVSSPVKRSIDVLALAIETRPMGEIVKIIQKVLPAGYDQEQARQLAEDIGRVAEDPAILQNPAKDDAIPALSRLMTTHGRRIAEGLMQEQGRFAEDMTPSAEASMRMVYEAVQQGLRPQDLAGIIKPFVDMKKYETPDLRDKAVRDISDDIVKLVQQPQVDFDKDLPALRPVMEQHGWDIAAKVKARTTTNSSSPLKPVKGLEINEYRLDEGMPRVDMTVLRSVLEDTPIIMRSMEKLFPGARRDSLEQVEIRKDPFSLGGDNKDVYIVFIPDPGR